MEICKVMAMLQWLEVQHESLPMNSLYFRVRLENQKRLKKQ